MREIKFRAWDEELKKMKGPEYYGDIPSTIKAFLQLGFEIMQYTGLKDRKGKECYEGDVLKIWRGYEQIKPYTVEDIREFYKDVESDDSYYRITNFEVIGNIYQNPEQEKLLTHIEEIIGIIQNDCAIIDSDQDIPISELRIGFAHIQGLCNGLKKRIEGHKQ